jgi:hypothetical protein
MENIFEVDSLVLVEGGDEFLLGELFVEPVVESGLVLFQDRPNVLRVLLFYRVVQHLVRYRLLLQFLDNVCQVSIRLERRLRGIKGIGN